MSRTEQHTPGPWFETDEDNQIRANTPDSGETTICEMWSTPADARLVKAAPDMLVALQDQLEWLETGKVDGVGFDKEIMKDALRAIITAATRMKRGEP